MRGDPDRGRASDFGLCSMLIRVALEGMGVGQRTADVDRAELSEGTHGRRRAPKRPARPGAREGRRRSWARGKLAAYLDGYWIMHLTGVSRQSSILKTPAQ